MSDELKISILVCYHKNSPYVKTTFIKPIHVGKELSNEKLEYCIGDNTKDNISIKNKSWCELTAIYWQWKNIEADYYGLFHYRRMLSFGYNKGVYCEENFNDEVVKRHCFDDLSIEKICNQYDIITAPYFNVHPAGLPDQIITDYELYVRDHCKKDIDKVIEIVKNSHSDFYDSLIQALDSKKSFFGNVFIMKKKYYFEYCEFIFSVLESLEKDINIDNYNSYQSRIFGFIAERLSNCYLIYAKNKYQNIKITSQGLVLLYPFNKNNLEYFQKDYICDKQFNTEKIELCLSFDDNYVKHGLVSMKSLVENFNSNQSLIIYIICGDNLSIFNREMIKNEINIHDVDIFFIEIDYDNLKQLPLNRKHISINTYFRLQLDKILPNTKKIIYIDSDVVVLGNIAELWNIELSDNSVAAVLDEGGILQSRKLDLGGSNNYFNAGVMVFDLEKIRKKYVNPFNFYMDKMSESFDKITLQDQDILNLCYFNDVKILPLRWNMNSRIFYQNTLEHNYSESDEITALRNPGIVHYTDTYKPWNFFCPHPYSLLYWKYRFKFKKPILDFKEKLVFLNHKFLGVKYTVHGDLVKIYFFSLVFIIHKNIIRKLIHLKNYFK